MATVKIEQKRQQYATFGLYSTSVGGDEPIFVRRKVGEPTDYQHRKSRPLKHQRDRLALASQHWNSLTPTEKAYWRRQLGYGYRSSSPQQETLLTGRQLFISQELYSLAALGTQLVTPYQLCIILCDIDHKPLYGELYLYYYDQPYEPEPPPNHDRLIYEHWDDGKPGELYGWRSCERQQISPGNWLFLGVPRGKQYYRVEGTASGYYDPKLPETQYMTEQYLLTYHYHVLLAGLELVILEPWTLEQPEFPYTLIILEPWTQGELPPWLYTLIIEEEWHEGELPPWYYTLVIEEEWHEGEFPPEIPPPTYFPYTILIFERWTS